MLASMFPPLECDCSPVVYILGVSPLLESQHFQTKFFLAAKTAQWKERFVPGRGLCFSGLPAATVAVEM